MNITIYGDFFGTSGYAIHTRNLANALHELNVNVRVETAMPNNWQLGCSDSEILMLSCDSFRGDDIAVFIGMPNFWSLEMCQKHKLFVGYVIWEGDMIPSFWNDNIKNAGLVACPSSHVVNAINKKYSNIEIIPHGYNPVFFNTNTKKCRDKNSPFTFVANKGWRGTDWDRGGMQYLISAFHKEFSPLENVQLVAKINPAYINPNDDMGACIERLGVKRGRGGVMQISTLNFSYEQLRDDLYYIGDVFVSPTRCDAFNIPCVEAMACGLPVITTDYGGQTDYVNDDNGWIIPTGREIVTQDISYEGVSWATIKESTLRKQLREVYELDKKTIQEKSKKSILIAKNYTWKKSAEKLLSSIKKRLV